MKEIIAKLNNHRQSPRKMRVVANTILGKPALEAKGKLGFIVKSAAHSIQKLLDSAIANGRNLGVNPDNLWVKSIRVDGGKTLYRRRLVSRGSAHTIHKRTSNIKIILEVKK